MSTEEMYTWVRTHREQLIEDQKQGDCTAIAIVTTCNMCLRDSADEAAQGILEGSIKEYIHKNLNRTI